MGKQELILVIDDEPDIVEMLQFQLEQEGYKVEVAYNGLQGLEKFRELKPSLVILDMNMPQMNGEEFFENICDQRRKTKCPVISLTAESKIKNLFKGFNVDGFMSKPFKMQKLLTLIEFLLSSYRLCERTQLDI